MRLVYLLVTCLLLCCTSVSAQVLYVKTTGSDANTGTSWATAFKSIQKALVVANINSQIFVAEGTYYPDKGFEATEFNRTSSFTLKDGVSLYGGFEPDFGIDDLNDIRPKRSTLSGDLFGDDYLGGLSNSENAFHVVFSSGVGENTVLDGFNIYGGYANGGGALNNGAGMYNTASSLQITNCSFSYNNATSSGGGIFNSTATAITVKQSSFFDNKAFDGAGMFNASSSPKISNCNFSGNIATNLGGAIYNNTSQPFINNCNFSANTAKWGGAVANFISAATLANCRFIANSATIYGGGIYNATSSPLVVNNSFSGNNATLDGGGIYNYYFSTPIVKNCIIWNNTATANPEIGNGDAVSDVPQISYSIVKGGYTGEGNLALDPLFIGATDLRLQACSPAINSGSNAAIPNGVTTDLDGNNRVNHSIIDMGAYEYNGDLHTYYRDADGDGQGDFNVSIESFCTNPPAGYVYNHDDCNDNYIGDCVVCIIADLWRDADGDGYGNPNEKWEICGDPGPSGWTNNNLDCNDGNANINPSATEICGNGIDDNCNGQTDEGCSVCGNPTAYSTTNITTNSATLNWVAPVDPVQWQVQYKTTKTGSQWKNVTPNPAGNLRSIVISSLLAKQNYIWHIRAKCGNTWASYTPAVGFKTTTVSLSRPISVDENRDVVIEVLKLHPNPTTSKFMLELKIGDRTNLRAQIQLVDILGRTVYSENTKMNNGFLQKSITVSSSLARGTYLVKVVVNDKIYKAQVVYQK